MGPTPTHWPGSVLIGGLGGTARLTASGEFDADNDHLIIAAVRRALHDRYLVIEIDMSCVTLVSASTVHVLLGCQRMAGTRGRQLWLRNVSGLPAYVLEVTATLDRLCLEPAPEPGC